VVAEVSRRKRAACRAHLRRYFHASLPTAPIAQDASDLILGIYRVEHDAKATLRAEPMARARRFLDDARVALDNNAFERSLRHVAFGRKNFRLSRGDPVRTS
jgi:hypothetical protein